jgi:hypothetical protein
MARPLEGSFDVGWSSRRRARRALIASSIVLGACGGAQLPADARTTVLSLDARRRDRHGGMMRFLALGLVAIAIGTHFDLKRKEPPP